MSPLIVLLDRYHFEISTTAIRHTSRSRWRSVLDSLHPDSITSVGFGNPVLGSFLVEVQGYKKPSYPVMETKSVVRVNVRKDATYEASRGYVIATSP